jgi:pyridoxal phosphate enzyme (YggS family)
LSATRGASAPDVTQARIAAVRARVSDACGRAGRSPADVTLVGVTKTHGPDAVETAWRAGLRDFGENRVQEAAPKITALRSRDVRPRWHLVGHLQTNKVKGAVDLFDILHSVDSERLASALSERTTRTLDVLIEVNVAGEETKHGVPPEAVGALAERIGALPRLRLCGLMTVAPQVDDPEQVRPVFRRLREIRDAVGLRDLSMGMTDDFEVAVEEGSTLIRVGRAIFGPHAGAAGLEEPL